MIKKNKQKNKRKKKPRKKKEKDMIRCSNVKMSKYIGTEFGFLSFSCFYFWASLILVWALLGPNLALPKLNLDLSGSYKQDFGA